MPKKKYRGRAHQDKARFSFDGVVKVLGIPFNFTSGFFKKMFKK